MTFHIGQKVVCVAGPFRRLRSGDTEIEPNIDVVYTVRSIRDFSDGFPGLHLSEIINEPRLYYEGYHEVYFDCRRFRHVVERNTDISVFTKMLTEEKIGASA